MLPGIVDAAQAVVQKCAHFCVGFFASGGISADVDAVPRIHAVRNVGSMNNVTARCIKSVMAVGIHNYLERFAARGHCLTQLDTRLRGRPIVAFPDVDASGCAGLPTIARAQRHFAARIKRDDGTEERRCACLVAKSRDFTVANIDGRERSAAAMRPADKCDPIVSDVGPIGEISERAQRIETPSRRRNRIVASFDRADFVSTARSEAVREQHSVAIPEQHFDAHGKPISQMIFATFSDRIHPAAAMQCDDPRISARGDWTVGQKQHRLDLDGRTGLIAIDRRKRYARERSRGRGSRLRNSDDQ